MEVNRPASVIPAHQFVIPAKAGTHASLHLHLSFPPEYFFSIRGVLSAKAGTHSLSAAIDATRPDTLSPFALYFLGLIDTAKELAWERHRQLRPFWAPSPHRR